MWPILFLLLQAPPPAAPASASNLDYEMFKAKVQPLLLEKRPGNARCVACHARSTAFRLQPLPAGRAWNEEETRKNFEIASRFVLPGVPAKSRLLTMPLEHEAGGTEFHPGGKHWKSQADPEWKALADWVRSGK
jgi:hypothetical protein